MQLPALDLWRLGPLMKWIVRFLEPGLAINADGRLQLIDQSNTPFHRADLVELLETVTRSVENDYPIRGTYGQEG